MTTKQEIIDSIKETLRYSTSYRHIDACILTCIEEIVNDLKPEIKVKPLVWDMLDIGCYESNADYYIVYDQSNNPGLYTVKLVSNDDEIDAFLTLKEAKLCADKHYGQYILGQIICE